jgi:glycosyltransferase involved in cell wall biosynthesis
MRKRQRVLFVQFFDPGQYPPILHASEILVNRDCDVLLIGIKQADGKSLKVPDILNRKVINLKGSAPGWRRRFQYVNFVGTAIFHMIFWRPDVVYVSDFTSAPIGLIAAVFDRYAVVYHEHDAPTITRQDDMVVRWLVGARRKLAVRSTVCVIPNQGRAKAFAQELDILSAKVLTVWNCPTLKRISLAPPNLSLKDGLCLYYHGSFNSLRIPYTLVEVLAKLPETVTLVLQGHETVGSIGFLETFMRLAKSHGVAHRISVRAPISWDALIALRPPNCLGLMLMPMISHDINMKHMVGASNKAFDYLSMGIPLIVSALPDWEDFFVSTGLAKSCDPRSADSLIAAVRWFLENPDDMKQMATKGMARIHDDLNYETQFEPVLRVLDLA